MPDYLRHKVHNFGCSPDSRDSAFESTHSVLKCAAGAFGPGDAGFAKVKKLDPSDGVLSESDALLYVACGQDFTL